jgi:hypothetical protein
MHQPRKQERSGHEELASQSWHCCQIAFQTPFFSSRSLCVFFQCFWFYYSGPLTFTTSLHVVKPFPPVPLPTRGFPSAALAFLIRNKINKQLKSKVGLALAKAAALRVNLNLDGTPIASKSHTHPSHSETSRSLTSSLSLGVPVPRPTQCVRDT